MEADRDLSEGVAPTAEVLAGRGDRAAEVLRGVGALSAEPVDALRVLAVPTVVCGVGWAVVCTVLVLNAGVSWVLRKPVFLVAGVRRLDPADDAECTLPPDVAGRSLVVVAANVTPLP